MADFKIVANPSLNAASDTSLTSAFTVPGEFSHYAIKVPPLSGWCATVACCNVRIMGSDSPTGTFYDVGYSNNPATTTSGFALWEMASSSAISGGIVICEALQFTPYAKLKFTSTATANTAFMIFGRKFD